MNKKQLFLFGLLLCFFQGMAQFEFKGSVDTNKWDGQVYLSVIDNYRKLNGVHTEQILMQTPILEDGSFLFSGDLLADSNQFYRIHVDTCSEAEQTANHFTGHCVNSKSVAFIANNRNSISFPMSFESQIFCDISASHPVAASLLKVDSLQEAMRYEFTGTDSRAQRNLSMQQWFTKMHEFGLTQNEPLVELYIHAQLTDRSTDLYDYYKKDLVNNNYYKELGARLNEHYPNSSYTEQYNNELAADLFQLKSPEVKKANWPYFIYAGILVLLVINMVYWNRKRLINKRAKDAPELTPQESRILELILKNQTNKEIAATLFVSHSTVKSHINNLYRKLGVKNREQLKSLYNKA